eukprot:363576-Chlamydomonas_euryale.AAC.5
MTSPCGPLATPPAAFDRRGVHVSGGKRPPLGSDNTGWRPGHASCFAPGRRHTRSKFCSRAPPHMFEILLPGAATHVRNFGI